MAESHLDPDLERCCVPTAWWNQETRLAFLPTTYKAAIAATCQVSLGHSGNKHFVDTTIKITNTKLLIQKQ